MEADEELFLDVLDYLLGFEARGTAATDLLETLRDGGSSWEVTDIPEGQSGRFKSTEREIAPCPGERRRAPSDRTAGRIQGYLDRAAALEAAGLSE